VFSSGEELIGYFLEDSRIIKVNLENAKRMGTFQGEAERPIYDFVVDPAGRTVVADAWGADEDEGYRGLKWRFWNAATGHLYGLGPSVDRINSGPRDQYRLMDIGAGGECILAMKSDSIAIFSVKTMSVHEK